MKKRFLMVACALVTSVIISCSSGDGGGLPSSLSVQTISGNAVDAIITNANISAYAWDDGIKGALLGESTIDGEGYYELDISSRDRPVLLVVSNGRYTEEASGINVDMQEGQVLTALIYYKQDTDISVQINPFTHFAACLLRD